VAAFSIPSLPSVLRSDLENIARNQGYFEIERLLQIPPPTWEPTVPLSGLPMRDIEIARKLRLALLPTLESIDDRWLTRTEFEERGLADFMRIHGYVISARHWRRLVHRTVERNCGAKNWNRLEIFLPATKKAHRPRFKKKPTPGNWSTIDFLLSSFEDLTRPNRQELALFWDAVCQALCENNVKMLQMVRYLSTRAPFLSPKEESVARQIQRKVAAWEKSGRKLAGVIDRRTEASGSRSKPQIPEEFRQWLIARTLKCGGRLSQAWREAWQENRIPAEMAERYQSNPASKSYVPRLIHREIMPDVKRLSDLHIGPAKAALKGPHITRTWEGVPSGVQFQSDDCTLPVYFYQEQTDGGFQITRGQFLPWIDTRTDFIVSFQLVAAKSYSSIDIHNGIVLLHDQYGLPEELYFERGIWQRSLLISGSRGNRPFKEVAFGLTELGIRVIHARRPQAKVVERVLGSLQNQMEGFRGYAGRNERLDCPESTSKAILAVKAGRAHPAEWFMSFEQWRSNLEEICAAFNAEPQDGKRLRGLSPEEAFLKFSEGPPVRLTDETRHLLASHRRQVKVGKNGIRIQIGKTAYVYKSAETGALEGERVLAWFTPQNPDLLSVTDLDCRHPFTVRRSTDVLAIGADDATIAEALRENAAHSRYARTLYGKIKRQYPEEFERLRKRPALTDRTTSQLGRKMTEQKAQLETEGKLEERLLRKGRRLSRDMGMRLAGRRDRLEDKVESYEQLHKMGIRARDPYSEVNDDD